jgi:hypothetical protein
MIAFFIAKRILSDLLPPGSLSNSARSSPFSLTATVVVMVFFLPDGFCSVCR